MREVDILSTKKILYVQMSGVDTQERTYATFLLAVDATIYFLMCFSHFKGDLL